MRSGYCCNMGHVDAEATGLNTAAQPATVQGCSCCQGPQEAVPASGTSLVLGPPAPALRHFGTLHWTLRAQRCGCKVN